MSAPAAFYALAVLLLLPHTSVSNRRVVSNFSEEAKTTVKSWGDENRLARRAVYVRWGSLTCPYSSSLLYKGYMANAKDDDSGGGFNFLCMHPNPQAPSGHAAAINNKGARLYGVEYRNSGALDKNNGKDAACAVCQWQNGGTTYVEWGHSESRDNPSTPTQCSNPDHEPIYTGLVMGSHRSHRKSEHVCVDLERAVHPTSDDGNGNRGGLYTTEMRAGSSDEAAYPAHVEVGCTVCGIPVRSITESGELKFDASHETSVYTRWGHRGCGTSRLIYTGFMAGSHYSHLGGGANVVCMTVSGAAKPSGYNSGENNGNLLWGTEYGNTGAIDKNHNGDAACAVCEYILPRRDVYVQWGRSKGCKDATTVYQGLVMGTRYSQQRSVHSCVDVERLKHTQSLDNNNDGNLLYTTEMEPGLG